MKRAVILFGVACLSLGIFASTGIAEQTYLVATFDDKTVDAPIGTGGAAVGEPISVDALITAFVRSAPFPSRSLEIQDNDTFSAGSLRFEFLNGVEVSSGLVVILADLYFFEFSEGWQFTLYVREAQFSSESFLTARFLSDGNITANDKNSSLGVIGSYQTGQPLSVILAYNMDAGTYDVYLDGVQVVTDEPHGVTDRGIGAVLFGCDSDADLTGKFAIDQIRVLDYLPPVAVEPATWGKIKALFRP